MFKFFDSLKKEYALSKEDFSYYNLVMLSGKMVYLESHKGLLKLSQEVISFRVKNSVVVILGQNLVLKELTLSTATVMGKIKSVEVEN